MSAHLMIRLSNDLTTLKQSKKLLSLGLQPETANFYCINHALDEYSYLYHVYPVDDEKTFPYDKFHDGIYTPIWSSGRLEEILEKAATGLGGRTLFYRWRLQNVYVTCSNRVETMIKTIEIFKEGNFLDFSKLREDEI